MPTSRRSFLQTATLGAAAWGVAATGNSDDKPKIQGFEEDAIDAKAAKQWRPVSDRKIRMGIVVNNFKTPLF